MRSQSYVGIGQETAGDDQYRQYDSLAPGLAYAVASNASLLIPCDSGPLLYCRSADASSLVRGGFESTAKGFLELGYFGGRIAQVYNLSGTGFAQNSGQISYSFNVTSPSRLYLGYQSHFANYDEFPSTIAQPGTFEIQAGQWGTTAWTTGGQSAIIDLAPGSHTIRIREIGPAQTFSINGGSASSEQSVVVGFDIRAIGVPEPSAWALLILGFGAIGCAMRRKPARNVEAIQDARQLARKLASARHPGPRAGGPFSVGSLG